MPPKRTLQKLASEKKLEAASARKTGLQLAAKTDDSGEISLDGLMEAAKTAEEGSQIQPEPGPSGGCGGHTEVKAQTGATREEATAHLISDDQESEDASGRRAKQRIDNKSKKEGQV
jgi:hypothetical protein